MKITKLEISRWKELPIMFKDMGLLRGLELGTYKGKYAEVLCNLIPGLDLTVVDAWEVYKGYKDYEVNDLETKAYKQTLDRASKFGFKVIKGYSLDVVKHFEDNYFDFIFIDANHEFRYVVDDLDEWSKKVKSGGIVSGHDFFKNHRKNFGVIEAVPAWCESKDIEELFVVNNDKCPSWFFIKK